MNFKKIFIVAGHSGEDPGAVAADGTTERSIVIDIASMVCDFIGGKAMPIGIAQSLTLTQKIKEVNRICISENLDHMNSLLLSIHADWRGAPEGVGAYYYTGSKASEDFSRIIAEEVAKNTERKVNYIKSDTRSPHGRLGIIRDTLPLAALVEIGSLRSDANQSDGLELLRSQKGRSNIAEGIVSGICDFAKWRKPESFGNSEKFNDEQKKAIEALSTLCSLSWYAFIGREDIQARISDLKKEILRLESE